MLHAGRYDERKPQQSQASIGMLRRAYVTSRSVYRPRVNHIPARPRTTNKILYLQAAQHELVRRRMQRTRAHHAHGNSPYRKQLPHALSEHICGSKFTSTWSHIPCCREAVA